MRPVVVDCDGMRSGISAGQHFCVNQTRIERLLTRPFLRERIQMLPQRQTLSVEHHELAILITWFQLFSANSKLMPLNARCLKPHVLNSFKENIIHRLVYTVASATYADIRIELMLCVRACVRAYVRACTSLFYYSLLIQYLILIFTNNKL